MKLFSIIYSETLFSNIMVNRFRQIDSGWSLNSWLITPGFLLWRVIFFLVDNSWIFTLTGHFFSWWIRSGLFTGQMITPGLFTWTDDNVHASCKKSH